jgi:hypothetical protein
MPTTQSETDKLANDILKGKQIPEVQESPAESQSPAEATAEPVTEVKECCGSKGFRHKKDCPLKKETEPQEAV